nr:plasmid replication protein RepC [Brucella intermedia]
MMIGKGFRAITPGLHTSYSLADQWGPQTAVEKKRAVLAFNRAASLLNLPSQAIELMNKLLSFSQDRDWAADTRPLVWPDTERLLAQVSFSLATLKRNMRRLSEAGLIAFRDSPNGKRFGKRDANGKIIPTSTYGIDLSPLGVRTPALEMMAEEEDCRRDELRFLARQWTCHRKMLAGFIDSGLAYDLPGPWKDCAAELDRLVELRQGRCSVEVLRDLCEALAAVLERARTAYAAAADQFEGVRSSSAQAQDSDQKHTNMSPKGGTNEPHKQNTNQPSSDSLYNERRSANAEQLNSPTDAGSASERRAFEKPLVAGLNVQPNQAAPRSYPIDLQSVLEACPELLTWLAGEVRNWHDLAGAAAQIRPALGISPSAWSEARAELGVPASAVALAIIVQKHAAGEIREPGAYLRGLTERHRAGVLQLDKSIRALLADNNRQRITAIAGANRLPAKPFRPQGEWTPRLI